MLSSLSFAVLALGDSNLLLDRQTTTAKVGTCTRVCLHLVQRDTFCSPPALEASILQFCADARVAICFCRTEYVILHLPRYP